MSVVRFVADGTIDDKILAVQARKLATVDGLIGGGGTRIDAAAGVPSGVAGAAFGLGADDLEILLSEGSDDIEEMVV